MMCHFVIKLIFEFFTRFKEKRTFIEFILLKAFQLVSFAERKSERCFERFFKQKKKKISTTLKNVKYIILFARNIRELKTFLENIGKLKSPWQQIYICRDIDIWQRGLKLYQKPELRVERRSRALIDPSLKRMHPENHLRIQTSPAIGNYPNATR